MMHERKGFRVRVEDREEGCMILDVICEDYAILIDNKARKTTDAYLTVSHDWHHQALSVLERFVDERCQVELGLADEWEERTKEVTDSDYTPEKDDDSDVN